MYTGSHREALGHNLVGLWFLSVHWGFLLHIEGYVWGHADGSCRVVYIAGFFWFVLWLWFLAAQRASPYFGLCFKLFI